MTDLKFVALNSKQIEVRKSYSNLRQLVLKVQKGKPSKVMHMVQSVNVPVGHPQSRLESVLIMSNSTVGLVIKIPSNLPILLKMNASAILSLQPNAVTSTLVSGHGSIAQKIVEKAWKLVLDHVRHWVIFHAPKAVPKSIKKDHARFKNVSLAQIMQTTAITELTLSALMSHLIMAK